MRKQGVNSDGEVLRDFFVEHDPVDLEFPVDDGLTRQEFAEEADINTLMSRYDTVEVLNRFHMREPLYLDFTTMPGDLQSALDQLDQAQEAFMRLPASTRREFDNDPVAFVGFAADPANLEKMREWGLARPAEAPAAPLKVEVVNPAAPATPQPAGS